MMSVLVDIVVDIVDIIFLIFLLFFLISSAFCVFGLCIIFFPVALVATGIEVAFKMVILRMLF